MNRLEALLEQLAKESETKPETKSPTEKIHKSIKGKNVIFTGTLKSMGRDIASKRAKEMGAHIRSNMSKNVDYVIAGERAGTKMREAFKNNIEIIYEDEFKEMWEAHGTKQSTLLTF